MKELNLICSVLVRRRFEFLLPSIIKNREIILKIHRSLKLHNIIENTDVIIENTGIIDNTDIFENSKII